VIYIPLFPTILLLGFIATLDDSMGSGRVSRKVGIIKRVVILINTRVVFHDISSTTCLDQVNGRHFALLI
jgi:hypothetical protein